MAEECCGIDWMHSDDGQVDVVKVVENRIVMVVHLKEVDEMVVATPGIIWLGYDDRFLSSTASSVLSLGRCVVLLLLYVVLSLLSLSLVIGESRYF